MNGLELLPFVEGIVLGLLLGRMKPGARLRLGAPVGVALGALATLLSGEAERSWGFFVVDVALVALSAAAALTALRGLGGARRRARAAAPRR